MPDFVTRRYQHTHLLADPKADLSAMSDVISLNGISVAESEFLAQETLITISPNFRHPKLRFISGEFGPFEPYVPAEVPLWLAVNLKKREKCTIVIPDWLSADLLENRIRDERTKRDFQDLPHFYLEIASTLLKICHEEIQEPDRVMGLLQDLENIRADRMRIGMQSVAESVRTGSAVHSVKLNNVSSLEIQTIKKFFLESMHTFDHMITTDQSSTSTGLSGGTLGSTVTAQPTSRLRKYR